MNDGVLYTGTTSASFSSGIEKKRQQSIEERRKLATEKRNNLLQGGDVAIDILKKEIDKLRVIDYLKVAELVHDAQPHSLEIEMLANERAISLLEATKVKITNAMRDNKNGK